ncbi:MAG: DUF1467 family protein [Kordiimonadaceae bacterium]|nr:DUF1467 family protein [Kordiimonadaceae bacterium]MBO6570342.1 DUF1467 family protein [Kordiimonadaceae bacterium]MBO6965560.1 DUF1467 family protein [Kordiimonadaceae bacterium]
MSIVTILLVFVVIWWLVFFAVLPLGVQSQDEAGDELEKGHDPGAPANPNLKKKMLYTTIIAAVLTVGYYFVATSGLVDFRNG